MDHGGVVTSYGINWKLTSEQNSKMMVLWYVADGETRDSIGPRLRLFRPMPQPCRRRWAMAKGGMKWRDDIELE